MLGSFKPLKIFFFISRLSCFNTYSHYPSPPWTPAILYSPLVFSAFYNPVLPQHEPYLIRSFIHSTTIQLILAVIRSLS